MNSGKDYYGALGVDRDAKPDVIRKAYLQMVRRFHPDLNPGDRVAAHFFREVQEAYEVLSDTRRREAYDRRETQSSRPFRDPENDHSAPPWPESTGSDQDPDTEADPDDEDVEDDDWVWYGERWVSDGNGNYSSDSAPDAERDWMDGCLDGCLRLGNCIHASILILFVILPLVALLIVFSIGMLGACLSQ